MEQSSSMTKLLQKRLVPRWQAGLRFEHQQRQQHLRYRDCILVYHNGRIRFERYCYGEAASLVFGAWVDHIDETGTLHYRQPFDLAVKPDALPTGIATMPSDTTLTLSGRPELWEVKAVLPDDPKNGYSRVGVLLTWLLHPGR